ncbi:MAG TPA: hypothetical protein VNT51_11840, partial [Miltoncostaeaceae bacterium]|nr:hypothetical protein [Miltoncostaeaceae bacterium]
MSSPSSRGRARRSASRPASRPAAAAPPPAGGTAPPDACQVHLLVDTRALDRALDYALPPELAGRVEVGAVVA